MMNQFIGWRYESVVSDEREMKSKSLLDYVSHIQSQEEVNYN